MNLRRRSVRRDRVSVKRGDAELLLEVRSVLAREALLGDCCIDPARSPATTVLFPEGYAGSVAVAVSNGVMSLKGEVATEGQKRLAGMLAARVPGCREVVNALVVQEVASVGQDRDRLGHS